MSITLCIPTIRSFDALENCVESAMLGLAKPDNVVILDNSDGKLLKRQRYVPVWKAVYNISIFEAVGNLGVAASWNMFMSMAPDDKSDHVQVICNDDVTFHDDTLARMLLAYEFYKEADIFGWEDPKKGRVDYAVFATRKATWRRLGGFDEQFYPGYFEDDDYSYRLGLGGCTEHILRSPAGSSPFDHVGSATVKSYNDVEQQAHVRNFRANEARYIAKWGGLPGKEVFKYPYNGETPQRVS